MPTSEQAADLRGPYGGELAIGSKSEITAIPVTSSSQVLDLTLSTYFGGDHYQSKFVRLKSDVNVYYFWTNASGATIDDAATGATNRARQGDLLYAGERIEEVPSGRYLAIKGSTGTLRISIVNQSGLTR